MERRLDQQDQPDKTRYPDVAAGGSNGGKRKSFGRAVQDGQSGGLAVALSSRVARQLGALYQPFGMFFLLLIKFRSLG